MGSQFWLQKPIKSSDYENKVNDRSITQWSIS